MSEFDGKVAVVTGASSGIGRRTAELLVQAGARVVIFARRHELLEQIARPYGDAMLSVPGDIAVPDDVTRLFDAAGERFGSCDLLVNNAGTIDPAPLTETTLERWERMFAVNVTGIFLTCRRALPAMIERRRGSIVNVASISGVPGPEKFPGWVSYCASKGAVISLTESLAAEVKGSGVRVNAISPGSVDTPMWFDASGGAPASASADEIAQTILFLGSERASALNGQNVHAWPA